MPIAAMIGAVLAALVLSLPASAHASCIETGAGLPYYRGAWGALSYQERVARCQEYERRQQESQDRAVERQERAAEREATRDGSRPAPRGDAESRQQECLVNAAACDTGVTSPSASGGDESGSSSRRRR